MDPAHAVAILRPLGSGKLDSLYSRHKEGLDGENTVKCLEGCSEKPIVF